MPEIDLRWPGAAGFDFIWLQILGYIGWPHDPAKRDARLARYFAEQLAGLSTRKMEEVRIQQLIAQSELTREEADRFRSTALEADQRFAEPARHRVTETFEEFGWFRALLSVAGDSPFPLAEVATTGRILVTIRSIEVHHRKEFPGGGSVKKAAFLLESTDHADVSRGLIFKNEKDIKRAWGKFKDVAHLAASLILTDISRVDAATELRAVLVFLMIARDFEKFGTSFSPHARKSPLIDPTSIWSIPESLPSKLDKNGWFPLVCSMFKDVVPRLHEDDLATLRAYRV
jgi:hypothetical protein